ncbi:MAG: dUTP diphosphatase [Phycisphaerales bacterium]|nr:dUTP diphosphatase [Phycisphaerales bacterium]
MLKVDVRFRSMSALATMPAYQSEHAAGMDLHAAIAAALVIAPGAIEIVPLGFSVEIPRGYEGQVRPRSGLATKHGITVPNAPGTVDADYRGEMKVALINLGRGPFTVEPSMRIAQLVISPVAHATMVVVEELTTTARGAGGFGSTGH